MIPTLFIGLLVVIVVILLAAIIVLYSVVLQERKRADEAQLAAGKVFDEANRHLQEGLLRAGEQFKKKEAVLRADAIKRSTAVVKGKVVEQLVPFTTDFGYNPRDARFLGSPTDFIVFEGLSEGDLYRVVFIEVKTGLSRLSKRERQLRDVIDQGEVYFEEVRL